MNVNVCSELVELLIKHKLTLSTCESASCGELASLIGTIPGVSNIYKGGFVTYANQAKENILKIPSDVIEKEGAVSERVAYLMAQKTNELLKTDISISITGNAGPNPMENKPVGLYYIGICIVDITSVYEVTLPDLGRDSNRTSVSIEAIRLLYNHIKPMLTK